MRFGTWNVRSLYSAGSLKTVWRELARCKLDLVGVQEVRWEGGRWCHIIVLNVNAPTEHKTFDVKGGLYEEFESVFDTFATYCTILGFLHWSRNRTATSGSVARNSDH
jgi:hypothetical protein